MCRKMLGDKNKVLEGFWSLTVKAEPYLHLKGGIKFLHH